jgi:hypothetical protein
VLDGVPAGSQACRRQDRQEDAALRHPHIVSTFDVGAENGELWPALQPSSDLGAFAPIATGAGGGAVLPTVLLILVGIAARLQGDPC